MNDYNYKELAIALVRLFVPLLCGTLTTLGFTFDANTLYVLATGVATVATFVWAWWKNNNCSAAAQEAQGVLDELKRGE